jgi:glycerophosphoryl diester phosphodiesterase
MRPEVHGHRGCAGPVPENTLTAFLHAMASGCEWIEMDVVVTRDGEVLVSHEPWMNAQLCRKPDGTRMTEEEGRAANIFRMPLAEAQSFPCLPSTAGPAAGPWPKDWRKPTLAEVVRATDRFATEHRLAPVKFNIEIKSGPELYGTYQPMPAPFAERVLNAIAELDIGARCMVQCFDVAVLEAVHAIHPDLPVALLVDNTEGLEANLRRLDFTPHFYSPDLTLVDEALVHALRGKKIGLLVWTVNEVADIRRMIALGVDGIITDHPARVFNELKAR